MILNTIQKVKLYQFLFLIDKDLADQKRTDLCPFCGSALHYSNYFRKPRGGPEGLPETFSLRHSLCCSAENCRRRTLPPSTRFWDRKVYWSVIILFTIVSRQKRTEGYSAGKIMRLFGVSRHTLKRWTRYFDKVFPVSGKWKRLRGLTAMELGFDVVPGALVQFCVERFGPMEGLIRSLRLLLGGADMF